jgi:hypothetical protein
MSFSPPAGTPLQIYQYESVDISASYSGPKAPFTYTIAGSTNAMSNLVKSLTPYVVLSNANYIGNASTTVSDLLVVNATNSEGATFTASYPVSIGSGRFLPLTNGSNIVLYVNEAFTPIRFRTQQLAINPPSTYVNNVPTSLPVGLGLVKIASNIYDLTGTSAAQAVSRNYYFLSTGASNSAAVSTFATIVVNPERVVLSPPGPTLSFPGLAVGSTLPSTPVTAVYPGSAIGNLLYTWTTLPPGFRFTDPNGNVISGNSMYSRDANSTITLSGTLTVDTLNFFVANGNPFTATLKAVRQTQPLISNVLGFQFSFNPSVILTPPVVNTQYVGVPFIPSGQPFFNAYTTFGSSSRITNIFSTNLVSDLSVIFHPLTSTADLSGTPRLVDVPGGFYTFRAVNASGLSTDISLNVPIALDTVSMTSTMDACSTFILSRAASNAKTGYYSTPLQFTAYAGSGNAVTFSAPALNGTGLSLSNVSSNTVRIVGSPIRTSGLTTLAVTATAASTSATSTLTRQFSISNDIVTINDVSFNAIQNVVLPPYQITGSSLSERPVVSFGSPSLPSGLSISSTGLVSGTFSAPASGTFTVNASTGYASGTRDVSYVITPDNILLFSAETAYTLIPGSIVSANVVGASYSGGVVSNYRFSNLDNTYGLTINSKTGAIGGTLFTGYPPNLLPSSCNFVVNASAGTLDATLSATLRTINPYLSNQYLLQTDLSGYNINVPTCNGLVSSTRPDAIASDPYAPVSAAIPPGTNYPTDLRIRPNSSGVGGHFLVSYNNAGKQDGNPVTIPYLAYSSDGSTFSITPSTFVGNEFAYVDSGPKTATSTFAAISSLASIGLCNWFTAGYVGRSFGATNVAFVPVIFRSSDDGITWTQTQLDDTMYSRNANGASLGKGPPGIPLDNSYTTGGFAVAYDESRSRVLIGGAVPLSNQNTQLVPKPGTINYGYYNLITDHWVTGGVTTPFTAEIANINTDVPNMFVATGTNSVTNITLPSVSLTAYEYTNNVSLTANTMAYSTDGGTSWNPASWTSTTKFNVIGGEIASDGNGRWLATGVYGTTDGYTKTFYAGIAYSTTGKKWTLFTLPNNTNNTLVTSTSRLFPHLPIGPIYYNTATSTWHVFVTALISGPNPTVYEYTHNNTSSFANGWIRREPITAFSDSIKDYTNSNTRLLAARPTLYTKSPGDIASILSFTLSLSGGPILDAPTYTNLRLVQYIPMDPIELHAVSQPGPPASTIYYYVATTDLPVGLSFNPQTRKITGTPAHTGTSRVRVFLRDGYGTSQYNLYIEVIFPQVTLRPQGSAGAYTSYIRQYTLVDAAQNSRNNKVLNESTTLGDFMAPYGGDTISAATCKNPSY